MHDGLMKIRVSVEFRELILQFNVCVVTGGAAWFGGALEEVGVAFDSLGARGAKRGDVSIVSVDTASHWQGLINPLSDEAKLVCRKAPDGGVKPLEVDIVESGGGPVKLTAQPLCVFPVVADGAEVNVPSFDNDVVAGIAEVYLGRREKRS